MYAYRTTWHIKEGHMQEAIELLQRVINSWKEQGLIGRLYYAPQVSRENVLVWEENWEDPEAHDKFWAEGSEVHTSEKAKQFFAKWAKVVEGKGEDEIWSLLK